MGKVTEFNLSDGLTEQDLLEALESKFSICKDQTATEKLTFFDTFDWRLYDAALLLYQSGNELVLRQLHNNDIVLRQPVDTTPKFVWDLPDSTLKKRLEPIIEMRTLLKLTEADLSIVSYRVLNDDDKTVVRLSCESAETKNRESDQPVVRHVRIDPVRGYLKPTKSLRRELKALGLEADPENLLVKALKADGRNPEAFSAGLKVTLDPHMRADEATKSILRSAARVIRLNEDGVRNDIDTEFLHDFRVAVRRTRSVLSQVKGVFPEETTLRFRADFAKIGRLSNELRDLDVYLLAEDKFKAMLPDALRDDIEPLFDYLRQRRVTALQRVVDGLNAAHYAETMQAWETFLNEPVVDPPTAVNAATPIFALAQDRIYRKYRRIVKWGDRIIENTEDEQLHALRIECKKLRYLMDFFQSLFPGKKINALIKQVKHLQTNLGDFNDLCVQEEFLLHTIEEMPSSEPGARNAFVAVGCLVGSLQQERTRVKASFAQTFSNFATVSNRRLFQQLFAPRKQVNVENAGNL